eukprot:TRINITY_DN1244_c0_g1_i1.p1 TRINITY_DN1244_c0_g1~~TRINITY_DN1244_c0_g1_i1.p1  ORF type:complete len:1348 (-),score=431.50 TRINITY_DN1244_c0_g1_i1:91-4134(-)
MAEQGSQISTGNGVQAVPSDTGDNAPKLTMKKLSREDVVRVVDALELLKSQGVDAQDERYAALLKILKAQSLFGYNFQGITSDKAKSNGSGSSSSSGNIALNQLKVGPGGLTNYQLFQLKAQILAFKYLSKNVPLPAKLLGAIRNFQIQKQAQANGQANQQPIVPVTSQTVPVSNGPAQRPPSTPQQSPANGTKAAAPVATKTAASPAAPPSIPPAKPSPLMADADNDAIVIQGIGGKPDSLAVAYVMQEREKRIRGRMDRRREELESLMPLFTSEQKRRAVIELKQIKLAELQKKVRADVTDRLRRAVEIEVSSADSSAFRRSRRSSAVPTPSARPVEYQVGVNKTTLSTDQLKRQKHYELLATISSHAEQFKLIFENRDKKMKKLCKELLNWHSNTQRRQQQQEERNQRQRLEALRTQNEAEYYELLKQAKNTRLTTLLKQTDEYLDKIGAMLKLQKGRDEIEEMKEANAKKQGKSRKKKKEGEEGGDEQSKPEQQTEAEVEEQKPEEDTGENFAERNKKYYTMAHSIEEKVTTQPEMLAGGKLKQYQLTGLQWLVSLYNNKLNGILADEMGLGKTIQTVSLIAYLMEKKNDKGPYLIVVPLSTLSNWALEFHKWAPPVTVVIYKGDPKVRKQIFQEELQATQFNVCLTSYEYVMLDKSHLSKIEWNYIIIDEGHRIKNKNSKLSLTLRQYMSRHRLLLTGTPLQNDLGELWALLNFLLPSIFNSSQNFEQWFNAPFAFAQKKGAKGASDIHIAPNEEEALLIINRLHKVLRPFLLRRLKSDVEAELPDKVEVILKCPLSGYQIKLYRDMAERQVVLVDPNNAKKNTKGFNNTLMQLQKICNHPYLFKDEYVIDNNIIRASGKFDLIDRILPKLRKAGHRILIFNQMTNVMSIMEDYFQLKGWEYLRLDGSTKSEDRPHLVKLWNAPDTPHWLFILSTKAGGLGLNLQTADTVIIFDTDWNPQADLQAQARAHRIGSTKEVRVFRLVSHNSVEERILEKATFKLDVDAKVIQAGMFNTHANDKMRKAMLESLIRDADGSKEEQQLVASDDQINSLIARTDDEYTMFQEMDKERAKQERDEYRRLGIAPPPRLMQESELPAYMRVDVKQLRTDSNDNYGRGMRERSEVFYDDNMSDSKFLKMVEKREARKNKRGAGDLESSGSDSVSDGFSGNDSDSSGPNKRRKTQTAQKGKTTGGSAELKRKCDSIWEKIFQYRNSEGRQISIVFHKLPSKSLYRDYYSIIKQPISMKQISAKNYRSPEEFRADFTRLFTNAQTYNLEGSEVFNDSVELQNLFEREYDEVFNPPQTQTEGGKSNVVIREDSTEGFGFFDDPESSNSFPSYDEDG